MTQRKDKKYDDIVKATSKMEVPTNKKGIHIVGGFNADAISKKNDPMLYSFVKWDHD